jgi:DNA (cytosine-5)-methyltransferase 1
MSDITHGDRSKKDLWQTPKHVFNALDSHYNFGLDAAASDDNFLCDCYLTESDDAISFSWCDLVGEGGWVWCNPPYSKIMSFLQKSIDEAELGVNTILLLPAITETSWFALAYKKASRIMLIEKRISFIHQDTGRGASNPRGSCIVEMSAGAGFARKNAEILLINRDEYFPK